MEVQLHQRRALHVPRLDVVNAADVQEVVLVVVGQKAFHLRRVHAAVGLADVDHRQVQAGEDVDFHPQGKRRKNFRLTPRGKKLLVEAREKLRELAGEILEDHDDGPLAAGN
jgi:hypothetical protein